MRHWCALALTLCTFALLALPTQATAASPSAAASTGPSILTAEAAASGELSAALVVTGTPPMTGTLRIATLLAQYFDRDVEEILALHADEFGFGSIAKALFTAVEADVPLEQILDMRLQEMGWGEIRQELGLHPGMPHASLGTVISQGHGHKGPDWMPPGQAKKQHGEEPGWTPPGQDKEQHGYQEPAWTPPGQSKKIEKSSPSGQKRSPGKP